MKKRSRRDGRTGKGVTEKEGGRRGRRINQPPSTFLLRSVTAANLPA